MPYSRTAISLKFFIYLLAFLFEPRHYPIFRNGIKLSTLFDLSITRYSLLGFFYLDSIDLLSQFCCGEDRVRMKREKSPFNERYWASKTIECKITLVDCIFIYKKSTIIIVVVLYLCALHHKRLNYHFSLNFTLLL